MKQIAVIFRSAPHRNARAREGLEFAMLAASLDQQVSLVFVDEGIFNLLPQQAEQIGNKDYLATFKAVDFYDIEPVMILDTALTKFGIAAAQLSYAADVVDQLSLQQHLQQVDEVLVF
ncbi:sulfurtransferase complex subunit TusC [Shewanella sp.]|uniref:sulfurtransferase complex subunit TusC n=1 Tax=Shewanella sp. TaxID=50422 RepID=UPI003A98162D